MTLRLGFLPSDFNPMLLILGEAEDFRRLGAALRRFAADAAPVALDRLPEMIAGCALRLEMAAGEAAGLAAAGDGFVWRLDPLRAADFAARAAALADPALRAGSDFLLCGGVEEVPVKLSRGEYTEDFLLPALPGARGFDSKAANEREA
ncbi:MAG: hypothetical protein KGI51_06510 [Rhodospirillales bacterium]|nr:hypothetical protein [Rhodospirillales bacterium]